MNVTQDADAGYDKLSLYLRTGQVGDYDIRNCGDKCHILEQVPPPAN